MQEAKFRFRRPNAEEQTVFREMTLKVLVSRKHLEQCDQILTERHYPNLVSRFLKLMMGRVSADWESTWGHPVVLAESLVDPKNIGAPPIKSVAGANWDPRAAGSVARWIFTRSTTDPSRCGCENWLRTPAASSGRRRWRPSGRVA